MSTEKILSSDGIPLEESLKKAERKNKLKAVLLVAPLFLFILIIYIFPIGDMLFRSVDDRMITKMLPKTFIAMEKWDGKDLPDEPVYKGLYEDLSLFFLSAFFKLSSRGIPSDDNICSLLIIKKRAVINNCPLNIV